MVSGACWHSRGMRTTCNIGDRTYEGLYGAVFKDVDTEYAAIGVEDDFRPTVIFEDATCAIGPYIKGTWNTDAVFCAEDKEALDKMLNEYILNKEHRAEFKEI